MKYQDEILKNREDYTIIPMPIALFCAYSECQTLIPKKTQVKKFDGATYVHMHCPTSPKRAFAAHKSPDTGLRFNVNY